MSENPAEKNTKPYKLEKNMEAATSYLLFFISGLMVLQNEKKDKFIRFHAFQSVYFSLGFLVLVALVNYIPMVGKVISDLLTAIFFFTWLVLIYSALYFKELKVPFFGDLAKERA
jgi:uncharacterized membrane protein